MALLHILHALQKKSPIKWELACVTVDPGTDAFDPSPLIPYLKSLGIQYYFLSERIIDRAKVQMQGDSICSFCARMKRGSLYTCARTHGYNVLALGQVGCFTVLVVCILCILQILILFFLFSFFLFSLSLCFLPSPFPTYFFSILMILLKVLLCLHFTTVN